MSSLYPQGMTLHSIGYAALKHPQLPPELPVPLGNQLGVLQRTPLSQQIRMMTQIASQYLPSLLAYQSSDAPSLNDPTNAQFFFSDALALINWLTSNPDVASRVAKHPQLLHDVIEKLLRPDVEKEMKPLARVGGATFEADFGSLLQFVSTILLRADQLPVNPPHPRMQELVPLLQGWKRTYRGKYIAKVAERLADQIAKPDTIELKMVREMQSQNLVCGYVRCGNKENMSACSRCKLTRYCCVDHQKKDWKEHKKLCDQGLIEEE